MVRKVQTGTGELAKFRTRTSKHWRACLRTSLRKRCCQANERASRQRNFLATFSLVHWTSNGWGELGRLRSALRSTPCGQVTWAGWLRNDWIPTHRSRAIWGIIIRIRCSGTRRSLLGAALLANLLRSPSSAFEPPSSLSFKMLFYARVLRLDSRFCWCLTTVTTFTRWALQQRNVHCVTLHVRRVARLPLAASRSLHRNAISANFCRSHVSPPLLSAPTVFVRKLFT